MRHHSVKLLEKYFEPSKMCLALCFMLRTQNNNFPAQSSHIWTHARYFQLMIIEQWSYLWWKVLQNTTTTMTNRPRFEAPNLGQTLYMNYFCNPLPRPSGIDTIIVSILLMEKLRIEKIQLLTRSHTDRVTCRISKQRMFQPSSRHMTATPRWCTEGIQDGKEQDTGPRWMRCISEEWFQWAQTLASSHTQESTRSSNLRSLVFFN